MPSAIRMSHILMQANAASGLSGPVGGNMSCVLGLDAVVSCDGGVTAGDVGGLLLVTCQCHVEVMSVAVCVTLTGCQDVVTRM